MARLKMLLISALLTGCGYDYYPPDGGPVQHHPGIDVFVTDTFHIIKRGDKCDCRTEYHKVLTDSYTHEEWMECRGTNLPGVCTWH